MKLMLATVAALVVAASVVTVVQLSSTPEPPAGRVQTDLAPLLKLCPGLDVPTSARWRFWRLGKESWMPVVGPDDYGLEALVSLPTQSAYTLRWSHPWAPTDAPAMNVGLASEAPTGVWLTAEANPCPGYNGRVYLLDGTSVVYLNLSTQ